MVEQVDCAVIGAGVVGLAVARALAMAGREVVVLEAADAFGTVTSARNSEVIHAGLYYPTGSLKARLCVAGNRLLRDYCASHGVDFRMVGKIIVASDDVEAAKLETLMATGTANGVRLEWLSAAEARALEPAVTCVRAILSPDTGIVDSHGLMTSLLGEAEAHGAAVAYLTPVVGGEIVADGIVLRTGGAEPAELLCRTVVNCGGFDAPAISRSIAGLDGVPPRHLCKGNYFSLAGRSPFRRLVYPMPAQAGLGVHFTLDLGGQGKFGPDVEWIDEVDYRVDPARAESFYVAIRRYWPDLPDGALQPAYAGIRPKIQAPGGPAEDFRIDSHGIPGYVGLYGIESPGLTACLSLADSICERLT